MAGYLGPIPTPQATQTRQTFTATASQTSFATGGYQAGYLDVYLNGVHLLDGTDYTASNGSDVVLTTGAASGDTLEVVAYTAFEVLNQNFTGGVTVDNDAATVLTVDRATSDGTIIDLQKNGTSVGSIGNNGNEIFIGSPNGAGAFLRFGGGGFYPATSTGANSDNTTNIGDPAVRFKDLYLSGGVYLGGTGSANKLDDYEEGTWTPVFGNIGTGTYAIQVGSYTKIGGLVTVQCHLGISSVGSASGTLIVGGLPFASSNTFALYGVSSSVHGTSWATTRNSLNILLGPNSTQTNTVYYNMASSGSVFFPTHADMGGGNLLFSMTYRTDA